MNKTIFTLCAAAVCFQACGPAATDSGADRPAGKYAPDSHSAARPNDVAIDHLHLDLAVDFEARQLRGTATFNLERNGGDTLVLDVDGLVISQVTERIGTEATEVSHFKVEDRDAHGGALRIALSANSDAVTVHYHTSPDAKALLWLDPEQTYGKRAPFLFTQGQAILTRSWIPIQDSPAIRITYTADIAVPEGMLALMSAQNPTEMQEDAAYHFVMDQPIPPYLMALAVGDLAFETLGDRSGVYAEPGMLDAAAYEFAEVEDMIATAESLYGPYAWERYDILVLPPSFPFGGMENPRLTFVTPTIIAGDRSLTSLIAHELAHSWSGNLVTNASWNDFWLNEGFTVYFEHRIMEALYGRGYSEMLSTLDYQGLRKTIEEMGPESRDTHLKLDLEGRNPDDGMNDIAYDKGYLMLRWLEELAGRAEFDRFLRGYFETHAFQTMTTEDFIQYLDTHLLADLDERPDVEAWIYGPGLPDGHPVPASDVFDIIDQRTGRWLAGDLAPAELGAGEWSTHEWLHFLRAIPNDIGEEKLAGLDEEFGLTSSDNSEIAAAWFIVAIDHDYRQAFDAMEAFLIRVGRRKFLQPIYEKLARTEPHLAWARGVYAEARPNYHAVAVATIDDILEVPKEGM